MNIRKFADTLTAAERKAIANEAGIGVPYFNQIACGARVPSAPVARKIHELSEGKVDLWTLRPDVWPPPRIGV